jgi:plastocyanin
MTVRRAITLAALVLFPGCTGGAQPEECRSPEPLATVRLEDFAFSPDCLTAPSGAPVRLENVGEAPHTFTIEDTGIDFNVPSGEVVDTTISGVAPGLYAVTCTYHPQMTATLTVEGQ